jgi:hypothetical protein
LKVDSGMSTSKANATSAKNGQQPDVVRRRLYYAEIMICQMNSVESEVGDSRGVGRNTQNIAILTMRRLVNYTIHISLKVREKAGQGMAPNAFGVQAFAEPGV